MSFELDVVRLVEMLNPREEERYTKSVRDELEAKAINNLYNITTRREDYVNPTIDGQLSWRIICSYDTNSNESLHH